MITYWISNYDYVERNYKVDIDRFGGEYWEFDRAIYSICDGVLATFTDNEEDLINHRLNAPSMIGDSDELYHLDDHRDRKYGPVVFDSHGYECYDRIF